MYAQNVVRYCAHLPTRPSRSPTLSFTIDHRRRKLQQVLGIIAMNRARKVLKSARPLRIIHRVKVRVRGRTAYEQWKEEHRKLNPCSHTKYWGFIARHVRVVAKTSVNF